MNGTGDNNNNAKMNNNKNEGAFSTTNTSDSITVSSLNSSFDRLLITENNGSIQSPFNQNQHQVTEEASSSPSKELIDSDQISIISDGEKFTSFTSTDLTSFPNSPSAKVSGFSPNQTINTALSEFSFQIPLKSSSVSASAGNASAGQFSSPNATKNGSFTPSLFEEEDENNPISESNDLSNLGAAALPSNIKDRNKFYAENQDWFGQSYYNYNNNSRPDHGGDFEASAGASENLNSSLYSNIAIATDVAELSDFDEYDMEFFGFGNKEIEMGIQHDSKISLLSKSSSNSSLESQSNSYFCENMKINDPLHSENEENTQIEETKASSAAEASEESIKHGRS